MVKDRVYLLYVLSKLGNAVTKCGEYKEGRMMSKYVSLVQLQSLYTNMQICTQICKHMQICRHMQISKYANIQICKYVSLAQLQQLLYHLLYCFELEFARDLVI